MILKEVLVLGTDFLAKKGVETPRLDCELIFAHALGMKRLDLYTRYDMPMEEKDLVSLRKVLSRRVSGEPVAYIVGEKAFYGMQFCVGPGVLVPRPDTEVLVDEVLRFLQGMQSATVLDMCSGSGAIALAIAKNMADISVTAIELDETAFGFCRKNVQKTGLDNRVKCLRGDLFQPIDSKTCFDVIVSNPPYIRKGDWDGLPAEVRAEPGIALLGGADGMDIIRRIVDGASSRLNPRGMLCIEIGDRTQAETLTAMLNSSGFQSCRVLNDLGHNPRAVSAIKRG